MAPVSPASGIALFNLQDRETVYQRSLLLHGRTGDNGSRHEAILLEAHQGDPCQPLFPPQTWPAANGRFKVVVLLLPGINNLRISAVGRQGPQETTALKIRIDYQPLQTRPLHLAVLAASDSPLLIDAPACKTRGDPHAHASLDAVVSKLRVAAYLWQALTAECMRSLGLGRRTFALQEDWEEAALYSGSGKALAVVPRVHLVRCRETTACLRRPDYAQQNRSAREQGKLYDIFMASLQAYGGPFAVSDGSPDRPVVAGLILDSHYSAAQDLILAHAALGGSGGPGGKLHLGMFGSHLTWAWPRTLDEVPSCLLDTTVPAPGETGNDAGDAGSAWEAAALGLGAMLHEVGHAFGCPHQAYGIMARGYVDFPRSFLPTTSFSTRTGLPGIPCVDSSTPNENIWHPRDLFIFRGHESFAHPGDPPLPPDARFSTEAGVAGLSIIADVGIAIIEWKADGKPLRREDLFRDPDPPKRRAWSRDALRDLQGTRTKLSLEAVSMNGGLLQLDDVSATLGTSLHVAGCSAPFLLQSARSADNQRPGHHWVGMLEYERKSLKEVGKRAGLWLDGLTVKHSHAVSVSSSWPKRKRSGGPRTAGGSYYGLPLGAGEHVTELRVLSNGSATALADVIFRTNRQTGGRAPDAASNADLVLSVPQGFRAVALHVAHVVDDAYCPAIAIDLISLPHGAALPRNGEDLLLQWFQQAR